MSIFPKGIKQFTGTDDIKPKASDCPNSSQKAPVATAEVADCIRQESGIVSGFSNILQGINVEARSDDNRVPWNCPVMPQVSSMAVYYKLKKKDCDIQKKENLHPASACP